MGTSPFRLGGTKKMKKLSTVAIFALLMPMASVAQAQEEDGRIYYNDGIRVDAGDVQLKTNFQLQPRYTFDDKDSDAEGNPNNTSGTTIRRARLIFSGHALDKAFSFKLQNDFASNGGGGDLKDLWIQWNGEMAKVRFGQFKVPFVRQFMVSSAKLFFPDRGTVSEFFDSDRNLGVMAHNTLGETGHFYAALLNGDSAGEGSNSRPVDTKHTAIVAVDYSGPDYGSRGVEGALGDENGFTAGGAVIYGQGEAEAGDFDQIELNGDVGFRTAGLDLQAEVVYSKFDLDQGSAADQIGYYVQGNYICEGSWGVGGRFGYVDPDKAGGIDDIQEYTLGLNYYIDGHRLKVQNQVTFDVVGPVSGEDNEEFRYVLQLAGYF